MAGNDWDEGRARAVVDEFRSLPGAALPMLHALQSAFGWIPEPAIPLVAEALNCSRADVVGVVSFYPGFRTTPPGRHVLELCRAEACQAMGSEALAEGIEADLGVGAGATTADDRFTLGTVYCLGNCALAPAAMLDGKLYGRLTAARAREILERAP